VSGKAVEYKIHQGVAENDEKKGCKKEKKKEI